MLLERLPRVLERRRHREVAIGAPLYDPRLRGHGHSAEVRPPPVIGFAPMFDWSMAGNERPMIFAAISLLGLSVLLLFLFPWAGIVAGIAAVVLFVLFLLGIGRGVTKNRPA
jgi:hypothetical protein